MKLVPHRSATTVGAICALTAILGAEPRAHAADAVTALKVGYEAFKFGHGLYKHAKLSSEMQKVKTAIINELRAIQLEQLFWEVDYLFSQHQEIVENPDHPFTRSRIINFVDRSLESWVSLGNVVRSGRPQDSFMAVTAYNAVAILRATLMQGLGQLDPNLTFAQSTFDHLFSTTMATNDRGVGVRRARARLTNTAFLTGSTVTSSQAWQHFSDYLFSAGGLTICNVYKWQCWGALNDTKKRERLEAERDKITVQYDNDLTIRTVRLAMGELLSLGYNRTEQGHTVLEV